MNTFSKTMHLINNPPAKNSSMYTNKVFKKGQKVFYLSLSFATIDRTSEKPIDVCVVIERTVDSCGKRQMTFVEYGNDFVFGRRTYNQQSSNVSLGFFGYFETAEQAFEAFDERQKSYKNSKMVIAEKVYSDENDQCFDEYRSERMKFKKSNWLN